MADNAASDWMLPVSFHFLVDFQNKLEHFQTSFKEVSGLNIKFEAEKRPNDTGIWIKMPHKLMYGNITVKRHVGIKSDDKFTKWVNTNLNRDADQYIRIYNMVIKLLDSNHKPLAGWNCSGVFPIQWDLSTLDAEKSELALETVVLTCNRIGRITV